MFARRSQRGYFFIFLSIEDIAFVGRNLETARCALRVCFVFSFGANLAYGPCAETGRASPKGSAALAKNAKECAVNG